MTVKPDPLPMKEACNYWKTKVPMSSGVFYSLAEQHRVNAFTVSGLGTIDMIMDVFMSLDKALEKGTSFGEWKRNFSSLWERKGWTGKKAWRVDNIFRTNIQTAYSVGRYKQMKTIADLRPYWKYDAVNDSRTRPTHLALDGKIFPHDHDFWHNFYPPNGFRCRCSVQSLSQRQVNNEGLEVERLNPYGGIIEPVDPISGKKFPARPLIPDRGFEGNPGEQHFKPDLEKYPAIFKQLFLKRLSEIYPEKTTKRFKKIIKQSDLKNLQVLVQSKSQNQIEGYKNWLNEILSSSTAKGKFYPIGNIPLRVLMKLKRQPELALIVIDDNTAISLSAVKKRKTLKPEDIISISDQLVETNNWYINRKDSSILMALIHKDNNWVKVVVKMNKRIGMGTANKITSADIVKNPDVTGGKRYKKIVD
ncbi:hypothetical protein GMMP15_840023 [Candidatus Magnetomoraceae bacterium gMMP-15]